MYHALHFLLNITKMHMCHYLDAALMRHMFFQCKIPVCLKEDFLGIPSRTLKHVSSSFVYASTVGICCSHPITYEQNYLVIKYNMPSYFCCFRCHNSFCSFSNCRQNPFVISNLNAQIYNSIFDGFTT